MNRSLAGVIVLGLVVGVIVLLFQFVKFVEVPAESQFQGEAARNPMLAAQMYLQELGFEVTNEPSFTVVPPVEDLIILTAPRRFFEARRSSALWTWVEEGGALWVTPSDEHLSYLEDLGWNQVLFDDDDFSPYAADEEEIEEIVDPLVEWGQVVVEAQEEDDAPFVDLILGTETLRAELDTSFSLRPGSSDLALSFEHPQLLRCEVGEGSVTYMTSEDWMTNGRIDQGDHAVLLARLVSDQSPSQIHFFQHDFGDRNLLHLLLEKGWPTWVAFFAFAALLAWRASLRFGPLRSSADQRSQRLVDHLEGAGWFLYRLGSRMIMVQRLRKRVMKKALNKHPNLAPAEDKALWDRLAADSELPEDQVHHAMTTERLDQNEPFVRVVRTLQRLDAKL